jgi:hypothetical protein
VHLVGKLRPQVTVIVAGEGVEAAEAEEVAAQAVENVEAKEVATEEETAGEA